MVPLGRKPVIQYVVEEAIALGLKQILIITGSKKRSIEDHFDYDHVLQEELEKQGKCSLIAETNLTQRADVQLFFTRQSKPSGLADAVALARAFVDGEDFAVMLGDNVFFGSSKDSLFARMMDLHEKRNGAVVLALKRVRQEEVVDFGIAETSKIKQGAAKILDLVEKPKVGSAPSDLAIAGRYIFTPRIFDAIPKTAIGKGGERQLTDAIRLLLKSGQDVWGVLVHEDESIYDVGTPYSYAMSFMEACLRDPEIGPKLREKLKGSTAE